MIFFNKVCFLLTFLLSISNSRYWKRECEKPICILNLFITSFFVKEEEKIQCMPYRITSGIDLYKICLLLGYTQPTHEILLLGIV